MKQYTMVIEVDEWWATDYENTAEYIIETINSPFMTVVSVTENKKEQ